MRREMEVYKRYIHDVIIIIIIIRKGNESLKAFLEEININAYNILCKGGWDRQQINFLDLVLYKKENKLFTKTYFKTTDRNGYILTHSYHHPKWIGGTKRAINATVIIVGIKRNSITRLTY